MEYIHQSITLSFGRFQGNAFQISRNPSHSPQWNRYIEGRKTWDQFPRDYPVCEWAPQCLLFWDWALIAFWWTSWECVRCRACPPPPKYSFPCSPRPASLSPPATRQWSSTPGRSAVSRSRCGADVVAPWRGRNRTWTRPWARKSPPDPVPPRWPWSSRSRHWPLQRCGR